MKMRTWNQLFVVMGLTVLAGIGLAGQAVAGGDHKGDHKKASDMFDRELKAADANGDKQLNIGEHATAARKMFETMDANKDNKVTAEEMEAGHAQVTGHKAKKHEMSAREKIEVCDVNKDGQLAAEEHDTCTRDMFAKMDSNKDGQLNRAELTRGHMKMGKKSVQK